MANRRPLVLLATNGAGELPSGDTISWSWLADYPELTTTAPLAGGDDLSTNRTLSLDLMLLEEAQL